MPDTETVEEIQNNIDKTLKDNDKTHEQLSTKQKAIHELKEIVKNVHIGINDETMMAFVGKRTWKLNPNAHTKTIRDKIQKLYLEFIQTIGKQKTQIDVISDVAKLDEISRQILELGLENFDYHVEADEVDVGPAQLKYLSQEIGNFLVVQGGKGATQHLRMLLKLNQLTASED